MSNLSAKVGPYSLVECLESGSAVQLWRAEHDGRAAAVRLVVDPSDTFSVSRWQAELEGLQALGPKGCLPEILAVFEDEKAFALDWVGEEGLDEKVERAVSEGRVLSVEEAVGVGLSVLDALSDLGGVHGALLPRHVRFRSDGRAVLYGIGRKLEQVQPRYMAPEMTGEGDIGLHTDQWHLAVVLFELTLGRTLYPGDWSKSFRLAFDGDSSEARAVLQERSPVLARALLPALRHEGEMGFSSHAEMALALQNCLVELEHGVLESPSEKEQEPPIEMDLPEPELGEKEAPPSTQPHTAEHQSAEIPESDLLELDEAQDLDASSQAQEPEDGEVRTSEEEESSDSTDWPSLMTELSEPSSSPEATVGPPQLERVQIALQQKVLPDSLQLEESQEDEKGPLGHGLSPWEIEAFQACDGADPVERGSWWVARDGAQTELPEPEPAEAQVQTPKESMEEPVALPEPVMRSLDDAARDLEEDEEASWPLLEASNLVGSLSAIEEELADEPQEAQSSEALESELIPEPVELTPEQVVKPSNAALQSVLEEQEVAPEVQFNEPVEDALQPPVLDELPPVATPAPARIQLPPVEELELPGREVLSELLEQEQSENRDDSGVELPWDQPEVVIPAPPKALDVAPAPAGTPDILSPRTPAPRNRMEGMEWNQAWRPQPLSERIARGGLLVLVGVGIAWVVLG